MFLARYQSTAAPSSMQETAQPPERQYSRIDQVDFLNFTYPTEPNDCSNPPPDGRKTVTLKDGRFYKKFKDGELQYEVDKKDIAFGNITGSPAGEAVIAIRCNFISNFWTIVAYTYTLREGIPVLLAKINVQGWAVVNLKIDSGRVSIDVLEGTHACPEQIAHFAYHWNGTRFALAAKPAKRKNPSC
jgi:hypothetical protein